MDYIVAFMVGGTPEETVLRFFVFVLMISGIFDLIYMLLGGARY